MRAILALLSVGAAVLAAGCGGDSSSASPTAPSLMATNDVLTGTVASPMNGVLQSSFNTFVVGQGGGSVSVTLTSAIETLPDGSLLPTVTMGLGVGSVSNNTCSLFANSFATAQGGAAPQLSGTISSNGTYCVQVSDVSTQLGPVTYSVLVTHP